MPKNQPVRGQEYVVRELEKGTHISPGWEPEYIELVSLVEERVGHAICGAKKRKKFHAEFPHLPDPCRAPAGSGTDHPGEGRCRLHGGNAVMTSGRWSMLRHRRIQHKVISYLESTELTDIRGAIATAWATLDELLGLGDDDDGEEIRVSPDRAAEVISALSRIGTLIKQHHDVTAGQRITIEVPQFMEWAEFTFALAIRYLQEANGDVRGFLRDAQAYYGTAVAAATGHGALALSSRDHDEAS